MDKDESDRCKRAVAEIRTIIPERMAVLNVQLVGGLESGEGCDTTKLYAGAMTDLVFDVIEHAISYADSASGLEAFKERLQDAIDAMDVAIDVWNKYQYTGAEWQKRFEDVMNRHR